MAVQPEKPRKTPAPPDTWTVRGVSPETRAAAKKAAQRAGKTLGEWVDDTLHRAATEKLTEAPLAMQGTQDAGKVLEAVLGRLERLEALGAVSQAQSQAQSAPRPPRSFWRRFLGLSEGT